MFRDNVKHAATPKAKGRLQFWEAIANICTNYL